MTTQNITHALKISGYALRIVSDALAASEAPKPHPNPPRPSEPVSGAAMGRIESTRARILEHLAKVGRQPGGGRGLRDALKVNRDVLNAALNSLIASGEVVNVGLEKRPVYALAQRTPDNTVNFSRPSVFSHCVGGRA